RFNYVFDRFVSRLSLWLYKARTYAGKVAILHSICLPVLWYQLSFVPADKELAKLIDKVMLQFMHGEEINPAATTTGLRLVKKEIVFADKDSCGLDLHKSLDLWQQHNRSVMIRCVQAFATPKSKSKMASWIAPGYTLLSHAFHPWGTPHALLFANGDSPFMRQLMKNPNVTPMWSAMLQRWFEVRWTPFGHPPNSSSLDIPLWHNSFSPGLENLYDHCLCIDSTPSTHFGHAQDHQDVPPVACVRTNLEPPTKQWMATLVTKLSALFHIVPVDEAPPFKLPTTSNACQTVSWMIRPDQEPILLTAASSKSAKIKPPPAAILSLIPTRHLNLPDDFYSDPRRAKQLCTYRHPEHILPRYGEFIFKVLVCAHAMQYLFQFRDSQPRCVFCDANETYQHYLFACPFGQSVWQPFKQIQRILQCSFPRNAVELLFETPKPSDRFYIRGFRKVWPIVRACVYYQIWLQRNDRTFRVDLTSKAPMEIAIHAACLVKLHLAQLLQVLPLKKGYVKVFNLLKQLSRDPWLKQHLIPDAVQD
ncbi:hypothetical protein As57867_004830, partial [Aphanomyces stellatus]